MIKTLPWPYNILTFAGRVLDSLEQIVSDPNNHLAVDVELYANRLSDLLYRISMSSSTTDPLSLDKYYDLIMRYIADHPLVMPEFMYDLVNNALVAIKDPTVGINRMKKYEVVFRGERPRSKYSSISDTVTFVFFAQDVSFALDLVVDALLSARGVWDVSQFKEILEDGSCNCTRIR